jgi:NAD+ kinase
MLAPGTAGLALTPLAPHGGVCPPLVVAAGMAVEIVLGTGHAGARIEVDGRVSEVLPPGHPVTIALGFRPDFATLVSLGEHEPALAGLRRRRILLDSPRVLARDDRDAAALTARGD